jgi:hypothetical protein
MRLPMPTRSTALGLLVGVIASCANRAAPLTPANLPPVAADCIAGSGDAIFDKPEVTLEQLDSDTKAWTMEVSRLVHSRAPDVRGCYERRLAEESSVRGLGTLLFLVSPDGRVIRAAASVADADEGRLERCFAHVMCTWSFPPNPKGDEQIFEQNITLTPQPSHSASTPHNLALQADDRLPRSARAAARR